MYDIENTLIGRQIINNNWPTDNAVDTAIGEQDTVAAIDGRSETHFNRLLELTEYLDKADADMYDELARLENN